MRTVLSYDKVEFKPSVRKTKCKNCCSMFGERAVNWEHGDVIPALNPRYVISDSGSWSSASRNVTLCETCFKSEIDKVEAMLERMKGLMR